MIATMKKIVLLTAILPALLFVSCNKENEAIPTPADDQQLVEARFFASTPGTKTVFGTQKSDKSYPVLWSSNDTKVAYVTLAGNSLYEADLTPSADGTTAEIAAKVAEAESYEFIFVSPAPSLKSANKTNGTINLEIPTVQESTPAGPDEASQVLYAMSGEVTSLDSTIPVTFAHATAYLHIFFTNVTLPAGASLQGVTIEAPAGCAIAGRNQFLPKSGAYSGDGTPSNVVSINTATTDEIWCGIVPADLSGKELKLIVNTDKGTLTKTVTMPSSAALAPGDVKKFTVSMAGITASESVEYVLVTSADELHYGDKIIIAAADADVAMGNTQNGNNRSQAGVTKSGNSILDPSSTVEIIELGDGAIPGSFALKATVKPGYLYAAAGFDNAGNYLRTGDELDASGSWEFSFGDITPGDKENPDPERAIILAKAPNRNLLRYNATSSLFSSYATTTSTAPVKVYRLKGAPDTSLRFKVSNTTGSLEDVTVDSAAQEVEVYIFGNVAWTASVAGSATLDKTSGTGNGIIKLNLPENTGTAAVNYTVTVSTSESVSPASYTLKIIQSAPSGPSTSTMKVGDILLFEDWNGGVKDDTPSGYNARATASTTVYGEAKVTYSQNNGTSTKLYEDALVDVPNGYTGSLALPENKLNLLVSKNSGFWRITGIPCAGVKKAKVSFDSNYGSSSYMTLTTDTANVTIGALSATNTNTAWGKKVYTVTFDVTFGTGFSGASFNLKLTNPNGKNNIRVTRLKVEVTEVL